MVYILNILDITHVLNKTKEVIQMHSFRIPLPLDRTKSNKEVVDAALGSIVPENQSTIASAFVPYIRKILIGNNPETIKKVYKSEDPEIKFFAASIDKDADVDFITEEHHSYDVFVEVGNRQFFNLKSNLIKRQDGIFGVVFLAMVFVKDNEERTAGIPLTYEEAKQRNFDKTVAIGSGVYNDQSVLKNIYENVLPLIK
jgi:hypothetical protein